MRPRDAIFSSGLAATSEKHWSVNPHWTAEFTAFSDHPITRGVAPFEINDEWYFHMRFRPDMEKRRAGALRTSAGCDYVTCRWPRTAGTRPCEQR